MSESLGYDVNGKFLIMSTWDDCGHLSEEEKTQMFNALPPHQRDARSKGIPSLGSGAIYPVPESEITVEPFPIPDYYHKAIGMDVGWNCTAAVFGALDPETNVMYIYDTYKKGQAEPSVHAHAIKARGDWIPVAIDPAARGRGQRDGESLWQLYFDFGLDLCKANNAVEAGIYEVFQALQSGMLKIFDTCTPLLEEYRIYRRDEKGKIVKENDHCLHPDTEVVTRNGTRRISELVGTFGQVLTPKGWAPYFDVRCTRRDADIVVVEVSNGEIVRCTPDHKFLTIDGWVEAKDLTKHVMHPIIPQSVHISEVLCVTLKSLRKRAKSSLVGGITCAASISKEMVIAFIEWFGSIIMGTSQKGSTFTTKITTKTITELKTLSSCVGESIFPIITKVSPGNFLKKLSRKPLSGMGVIKAKNGISSTTKTTKTSSTDDTTACAKSAILNLMACHSPVFAATIVNQSGEDNRVSMISKRFVWCVIRRLCRISTIKLELVVENVVLTSSLRKQPQDKDLKSDVYCMTVPGASCFALEADIVSHNCMDAMRYTFMTRQIAMSKPKNTEDFDDFNNTGDEITGY